MALIKCSECGHEVSDKASACPNCGCPIEKGLICNECGNSVSPSDKSCPKCGNPIKSKNGFNWKKHILSIAAILFVLGGVYAIWQLMGSSGKDKDIEITNALSKSIRKYDALTSFHEGFAAVVKDGKWGYINSDGEEVIPCKYDGASPFSEGLACVYIGDDDLSIEFIDEKGNTLIKGYRGFAMNGGMTYEPITFKNGVCCVSDKEHNDVWIDKNGNKVNEPQNYDEVNVSDGTERFEEEGKVGVKDTLGNVLIKAKYSYVDNYSQGLAVAYLLCGNKVIYGYVDKKGNSTFTNEDFAELEKYEAGKAEQKRQEEERKRREGVEKIVSITVEREDNHGRFVDVNGNYGAKVYSGMWHYGEYAITNLIKIPNGKVWIFKKVKLVKGSLWGLYLFYYAKEYGHSRVDYFDKEYNLPEGNPPVLREGDAFRIAARSICKGITTVEVYFSEKDEEYYY